MYSIDKEQKIVEIEGVKFGGQPGENPPVAIGSVFYSKHKALIDEKTGEFDKDQIEQEVNEFMTLIDDHNMQGVIDVVGAHPEALVKECTYIADLVDIPFLIDGLNDEIRLPAVKELEELGLLDRGILNSIDENTSDEACEIFREVGVKNAVLLTFGTRYIFPKQKIKLLENDLIPKAQKANIQNFIVDTAVLDIPSVSLTAETTRLVKNQLGLPAGYAPSNAIYQWDFVKQYGQDARCGAIASIMVNCIDVGGDFVLFGPIKYAKCVIPSLALITSMKSYYRKRILRKNVLEKNPLKKIF